MGRDQPSWLERRLTTGTRPDDDHETREQVQATNALFIVGGVLGSLFSVYSAISGHRLALAVSLAAIAYCGWLLGLQRAGHRRAARTMAVIGINLAVAFVTLGGHSEDHGAIGFLACAILAPLLFPQRNDRLLLAVALVAPLFFYLYFSTGSLLGLPPPPFQAARPNPWLFLLNVLASGTLGILVVAYFDRGRRLAIGHFRETGVALGEELQRRKLAEHRLRQVTEHLDEVFWLVGPDRKEVQYVSPAFERVFGRDPSLLAEGIGRLAQYVHPEDRSRFEQLLSASLPPEGIAVDYRIVRGDGQERWISTRAFCTRSEAGVVSSMASTSTDVTEKKRAELALMSLNDSLVEKITERTRWLEEANARLQHEVDERARFEKERERLLESEQLARAEAERASSAKDSFLAVASHELRTPLAAILLRVQFLRRQSPNPKRLSEGLARIEEAAWAQKRLVSDLLDVSSMQSGKLALEFDRVSPDAVARLAMDTVQDLARGKGITLRLSVLGAETRILGDSLRLQQILWNLLTNAIKFTPEGGFVEMEVSTFFDELGAPKVRFRVTDTGVGIEPELLTRLFEPFSQADFSSKRQYGGLGLGLALARSLVQMHNGTVTATSAGLNKGATFTVELPEAPEEDTKRPSRPSSTQERQNAS